MEVMSFTQFFTPTVEESLKQFQIHIDSANQIMQEIQKQIDYNNNILKNVPVQTPQTSLPDNQTLLQNFIEKGQYHAPSNTPQIPLFDTDYWSNFIVDIVKKSLWLLWNSFIGLSHWLCILVAVCGILAYIMGYKKGIIYTGGSIAFYIIIKLVNLLIGG